MILPDIFIDQDTPEKMYDYAGLNATHIADKIEKVFFNKDDIKIIKKKKFLYLILIFLQKKNKN